MTHQLGDMVLSIILSLIESPLSPGGHMIPSESSGDHAPRIKGMQTWPSEPFSAYPGDPVSLIPQCQLCSRLFSDLPLAVGPHFQAGILVLDQICT